ncbi:hypothetical protein KM043_004031 [Ampulex compressa]|nr:hypothetical protein KM043_004031 [Ampulex compressa]
MHGYERPVGPDSSAPALFLDPNAITLLEDSRRSAADSWKEIERGLRMRWSAFGTGKRRALGTTTDERFN